MIEELMRWLGLGLCHQLPERSFFGGGVQLPVCARDTGIYVGFAVALLIVRGLDGKRRSAEVPPLGISLALGAFIGAMLVDGVSSYAGWRETTNGLRLLTGLTTGYALAAFTVPLLNGQLWRRPGRTRVLGTWSQFGVYCAALGVTYVAVWFGGPMLGIVYPILTSVAILFTFAAVNGVVVSMLPPFERRYDALRATWPVFAIALVVTLVELAGAAWLKVWMLRLAQVVG